MTKLPYQSEWSEELLQAYGKEIDEIATKEFGLDIYPYQVEIISFDQMISVYSSIGLPISYNHWSFGKQYAMVESRYKKGYMGLAYEIVINSNPCIASLMEENTLMMQALVIAHAAYGHNSFFKNNHLFKTWGGADAIIDYLVFAKKYISECEEKYGREKVELFLDSCHALQNYGVDRYKRPGKLSVQEEEKKQKEREAYRQSQVNTLWEKTIPKQKNEKEDEKKLFPKEPQENILYFIEKNSPFIKPWQVEIIRITRKIAQYFYPQRQTKVMNEGWATFWHYNIINRMYDKKLLHDGFMIEFAETHSSVLKQPGFDVAGYSGLNPYRLGFDMFSDIRRICEDPTEEDRHWFPEIAGKDWLETLDFAMQNFKDESFIMQYLSPNLIRRFRLFSVLDDEKNKDYFEISAIHNEEGYKYIRRVLANQYNLSKQEPNIQVQRVNLKGDRSLTLRHIKDDGRPLEKSSMLEVVKHATRLWGCDVYLESEDKNGRIEMECHAERNAEKDDNE